MALDTDLLQQTFASVQRIEAHCQDCNRRTCGLEKAVYGNGEPGLKTRVDRMEQAGVGRQSRFTNTIAVLAIVISALGLVAGVFWKH